MTTRTKPAKSTVSRAHFNRVIRQMSRRLDDLTAHYEKRVKEAYWSGLEEGGEDEQPHTFGGRRFRRGYRTYRYTVRDETSTSQEAAIERSYRQWATNPLAMSIANTRTDYVWGDGVTVTAEHEDVQAVLDAHLADDTNDWEGKGHQRVRDLGLYGELILEAFARYDGGIGDGHVTLGAIDPSEIDAIITDPDNREETVAIRLKGIMFEEHQRGRLLKVVATDRTTGRLAGVRHEQFAANRQYEADQVFTRHGRRWRATEANVPTDKFASGWSNVRAAECCYGKAWRVSEAQAGVMYNDTTGTMVNGVPYDGQCFIVQVNKTSIGMRGRPDGLPLIDWLDRVDQLFFDILEHAALLKDIVWDLLITGGNETTIKQQVDKFIASVQSGKVWGHNEGETLTERNPDLKAVDWSSLYDTVLNFIAAGARLPVFMLGSGGDANLATATAQGSPTFKGFSTRQGVVRRFLRRILQYQVDCAVEANRLPEYVELLDENGETKLDRRGQPMRKKARDAFAVTLPEISPKDTAAAATTFSAVAAAVASLYGMKLLPLEPAVQIIARVAELLGIDLDIEAIVEALRSMDAVPTDGLADALDKAGLGGGSTPPGTNGNSGGDLSKLLAVMNEGAAEEPKGNGMI